MSERIFIGNKEVPSISHKEVVEEYVSRGGWEGLAGRAIELIKQYQGGDSLDPDQVKTVTAFGQLLNGRNSQK